MCSHYTLDSPTLYWNLPPPMWGLSDNSTPAEPMPPLKKPRRRRQSKKQPPLQHSQTHAAFCHDPLCVAHR